MDAADDRGAVERRLRHEVRDVTPNLIVSDIDRSIAFYRDVLGFSVFATVPEGRRLCSPGCSGTTVNVFLNTVGSVKDEHPELAARPLGGTKTMFIMVEADSPAAGSTRSSTQSSRRRASSCR